MAQGSTGKGKAKPADPAPRRPTRKAQQPLPAPVEKFVSRHERDLKRQRQVKIGVAVAAALLVLVLAGGALNEFVLKPRATLASVDGVAIRRTDYWKGRAVDLLNQAQQYDQFAQFSQPDQAGQFLRLAEQARAQAPEVWGTTDVDPGTLGRMIEDELYVQGAEQMGLGVTDADAETWALAQFGPPDAPLLTPVPTPTFIPARADMATSTAEARAIEQMNAGAAPTSAPLPAPPIGAGDGIPAATPVPTEPPATPSAADAMATAEAGLSTYEKGLREVARMSPDDYLRLVAKPALSRERVNASIAAEVGQTAPMVEASHILVATKDLADQLAAELSGGADFAELAKANSTDTSTAGNGGDLGWFTADEMVGPFSEAAFALQPGGTSAPVQTEYGWHLIRVRDTDQARPLTDEQITRIAQKREQEWLDAPRAAAKIESTVPPTPTPLPGGFVPPLDAPPPPLPTPAPAATPVAP